MANQPTEIRILTVTDDPSAPRQLQQMLGDDAGVRTLFADTGNAVSRTFESERVDMVVIHVDSADLPLFEASVRAAREQDRFVPILAMIEEEDSRSAMAVAAVGVEGFVNETGLRQLKRLVLSQVESLRARKDAEQALKSLADIEDRYTLLLDSSSEAIAYIHEGLHIYANRAYLELFDFESFEDLEGLSMLDLLSSSEDGPDLRQVLKAIARDELPEEELLLNAHRQDGPAFTASVDFSPARYGGEYCAQMLVREKISQADPELEEELRKLKTSDLLTGMLNTPAFIELLNQTVKGRSNTSGLSMLVLSLDNHDNLLDKVGVGATDDLVRETSELFRDVVGEEYTMARLRDHTFALVADCKDRSEAEKLASEIVENCSGRIIDVRDNSLTVSVAVGLAVAGSELPHPEALIEQAESALAEALRAGGNGFVRYRPRVSAEGDEDDAAWAERLRHALDHDEFGLVTSPITSMEDDDFLISEVETRLRPEDSDEVILPSVYMHIASRVGLATKLDAEMMDRLQALASERKNEGGQWLVPLSLETISNEQSALDLFKRLGDAALDPKRMILGFREAEIREKLRPVQSFIERFRESGCRFALCDVGPDAPAESLLRHLDLDFLRLAPEMIQDLSDNEDLRHKLSSLVSEARQHETRIIAPQVENTGDLATLWQFGIILVQGEFVREEASA
ncbi:MULTISPECIES: EAL domain-containing protein [unclassified Wenzhouxiangella]|uniref:EAL domain-containing response regulator n=1 Tax=unclassified Wenzhouxiangella TaxID=2613841 RepID=UPI000E32D165|nr:MULTISPECIES: EAL domain-containing protein [unclassified Wenzhouxiangella]RFF28353.1 EAL domain-containing protein [Wenzhouxiangella sp. 15181]RFP68052.1 EAL domain-containing protein [Wenzhouxiangella sp. 15190]